MRAGCEDVLPSTGNGGRAARSRFRAWYAVGILFGVGLIAFVDRMSLSLLIDPVKASLRISDTQAGLLLGPAFALVYTGSAFPAAFALDKFNRKWILAIGIGLWSACTAAAAFAPTFWWLFAMRMGVGIGEAVLNPAGISMISDLFARERRPTPASIFLASQGIGAASSFLLAGALMNLGSWTTLGATVHPLLAEPWRMTLFVIGVPGLIFALIVGLTVTEPKRGGMEEARKTVSKDAPSATVFGSRLAAVRFYLPFLVGTTLIGMMMLISVSWVPTYLIRTFHGPLSHVGYLFGTAYLLSTAGTLLWPAIAEHMALNGRKDSVFVILALMIPCALAAFIGVLLASNLALAVVLVAIFFAFANGVIVMPAVVISSIGGVNVKARLMATNLFVQAIVAWTIGPVIVPFLSDVAFDGQLGPAMLTLAIIVFPLSFILLLAAWRPYARLVYA